MEKLKMADTAVVLFLLLMPWPALADTQPRPQCTTQFAIAAEACATIVVEDSLKPSKETHMQLLLDGDHDNNNGTVEYDNGNGNENEDEKEHKSEHGRHGSSSGHNKRRSSGHSKNTGNRQGHGGTSHSHSNSRSHEYHHPKTNNVCCRWLKEVDNNCVCAILYRLPVFLSRPKHMLKVTVGNTCEITYDCSGRALRAG